MFEERKQKKLDKAIELLEDEAKVLNNEFTGIDNWIKNNPDTDPNLYQMMESVYKFGKLSSTYEYYYDKYQIKEKPSKSEFIDEDGNKHKVGDLGFIGPMTSGIAEAMRQDRLYNNPKNVYLTKAKESLEKMKELRYSHDLFANEAAKELYDTVYNDAINGYFDMESEKANELKKEVLRKLGGVINYIHQVQTKENPSYLYDNKEEFETLQRNFKEYLSLSKNKQFKSTIAQGIVAINNNYLYNPEIDLSNQNKGPIK